MSPRAYRRRPGYRIIFISDLFICNLFGSFLIKRKINYSEFNPTVKNSWKYVKSALVNWQALCRV